jgi:hypothetical protein
MKWINIKDERPAMMEKVLIVYGYPKQIHLAWLESRPEEDPVFVMCNEWGIFSPFEEGDEVTYWMPLPNLPN